MAETLTMQVGMEINRMRSNGGFQMNGKWNHCVLLFIGIASCFPGSSNAQKKTEMVLDMIMNAQIVAIADSLYADGKYAGALEKYNEFLIKHPRNLRALFNSAHCLQCLNELESARDAYGRVLAIDSTHVPARVNRSSVYVSLGQFENAIADARRAAQLDPTNALAHYNWGVASVGLNDLDGAMTQFSDAIRLNPSDAKAYFNRGVIRSSKGQKKEACADWKQSLILGYTAAEDLVRESCK